MTPAPTPYCNHLTLRGPGKRDLDDFTQFFVSSPRLGATVERMGTHVDEAAVFYRQLAHTDPAAIAQFAEVTT